MTIFEFLRKYWQKGGEFEGHQLTGRIGTVHPLGLPGINTFFGGDELKEVACIHLSDGNVYAEVEVSG